VCDNFVDEDGDGKCDHCKGNCNGKGNGKGYNYGKGFVDEDGDGKCDHRRNDEKRVLRHMKGNFNLTNPGRNPIVGATSFSFSLDEETNVDIDLYRSNGDPAEEIFEGTLSAGTHTMDIDGSDLSPGAYTLIIIAGDETYSRRIIITK
jgi:hypothetical protein